MPDQPHRPKFKEKLFFFISGAIISSPFPFLVNTLVTSFLNSNLPNYFTSSLISSALVAPVIEEFAKAYPLFYRHGETERSLISLAFWAGLGFGVAEFLLYVFVFHAPILLRLPALLFHATNTTIVAYGIGKNKVFKFYLIAVALHFINNFFASLGIFWLIGGISATAVSYLLATFLYAKSTEKPIEFQT